MNTGCRKFFQQLFSKGFPIIKWFVTLVLIVNLSSCVEAANSQEVSINPFVKASPVSEISGTFSETAPPNVIQALRPSLEGYQPQVSILSPQVDEVLQDNIVTVSLQVKDLPIFKDPQWQLSPFRANFRQSTLYSCLRLKSACGIVRLIPRYTYSSRFCLLSVA